MVTMPSSCASCGMRQRDRLAGELDGAAIRRLGAGEDLEQRRLAGAVLAEQRVDLSGSDLEVDVLERLDARESSC